MTHCVKHRGFMLLEIVVAVGLLVLGMALVGAQMQGSMARTHATDLLARAVFLAESRLAEIDTGLVIPKINEPVDADFGRLFPQWASRVSITPLVDRNAFSTSSEPDPKNLGLLFVGLEILYDPERDIKNDFDFDGAEVVASYHTLRAAPRPLNLIEDFGMSQETATQLSQDLLGSGLDFNVEEFNPDTFRNLGPDELVQLLPALMNAFGGQLSDILGALPNDIRQQLQALLDSQADTNPDATSGDNSSGGSSSDTGDGQGDSGGGGNGQSGNSGADAPSNDASANGNPNDNPNDSGNGNGNDNGDSNANTNDNARGNRSGGAKSGGSGRDGGGSS